MALGHWSLIKYIFYTVPYQQQREGAHNAGTPLYTSTVTECLQKMRRIVKREQLLCEKENCIIVSSFWLQSWMMLSKDFIHGELSKLKMYAHIQCWGHGPWNNMG